MPSTLTHFRVEDLHSALKAPAVAGAIYHSDDKIRDHWVIAISHAMVAAFFHVFRSKRVVMCVAQVELQSEKRAVAERYRLQQVQHQSRPQGGV